MQDRPPNKAMNLTKRPPDDRRRFAGDRQGWADKLSPRKDALQNAEDP